MEQPADTLDAIKQYLQPVRDKVAAEESYQDSSGNTVEGNDKKTAKDSQTNLGLEQSEDAKDGGSTVEDESDNTDALQAKPEDTQGPQTLSTDDPVTSKGNIGPIVQQEITQTQKTASESARIANLANALLPELQKVANAIGSDNAQTQQGAPIQKTAAEQSVDAAGEEFKYYYAMGMEKRAADEAQIQKTAGWEQEIAASGGVGAILDKIAMETPEAVIPPEALAPAAPAPELGGMGGMGEEAPLGGELGMEAPVEGGEEGLGGLEDEISDIDIDAIAEALAAEGITAEDMAAALQDHQTMQAEGVQAPELAQALSGEEVPPPVEGMGEVEKIATETNRETVQQIRNFILREV